jgi:hypothetical protein
MSDKDSTTKKPLFHFFHQYDGHENLKQSCAICGYVRFIPCTNHNWETISSYKANYVHIRGDCTVHEQKCKNCGELRSERL